jgi:pimeloyl-ACP methyl ester carboxylesterase
VTIGLSDCSKLFNISAAQIPSSRLRHLSFLCGKVTVPLNYDAPDGPTIDIQVLRLHDDRAPSNVPSLVLNPGGPGASGLALPIDLAPVISDSILQHYDLVGFDPRGVGLSSPLQCLTDAQQESIDFLDPDVRTPTGLNIAKQAATEVATACTTKYGAAVANYNTLFTAMDLDRIRAAMGDAQLNYLGFSYGTELGAVYAHLYPTKIRVAVLDGAVDPTTDYLTSAAIQTKGFEDAFDQFAADCKTRTTCKSLGDVRATVTALVARADVTPIKSSATGETRAANGAMVLTAITSALYLQSEWPDLATALQQAQQGDSKDVFALADDYNDSFSHDAFNAIQCNDTPVGLTDATIQATAAQWATAYPLFGLSSAAALTSCEQWQPVRHVPPMPTATGSPPILVVGTIHDPATPYSGAQHLTTALTTGVLLTWNGQGHTAYLRNDCIDSAVDAYLVSQKLPATGTVCPA